MGIKAYKNVAKTKPETHVLLTSSHLEQLLVSYAHLERKRRIAKQQRPTNERFRIHLTVDTEATSKAFICL